MADPLILLVDGHGLAYRAFYALPELNAPDGTPTNAVLGFSNMFLKVLEEWRPDYTAVIFDAKGPTFRSEQYAAYKEGRAPTPEELTVQIPLIEELVEAMGFPVWIRQGVEADDVIAATAHRFAGGENRMVVLTADKDLLQILGDGIQVLRPKKGVSTFTLFDRASFREEYGFAPESMRDYLAMVGDSVDNVPGIKGIGDKTARKLLGRHPRLEEIYDHLDECTPAQRKKLEAGKDQAFESRELVTLREDEPLELADMTPRAAAADSLSSLCRQLGLGKLQDRLFRGDVIAIERSAGAADGPERREASLQELLEAPRLALTWDPSRSPRTDGEGLEYLLGAEDGRYRRGPLAGADREAFTAWLEDGTLLLPRYKAWCHAFPDAPLSADRVWDARVAHYLLHPDSAAATFPALLDSAGEGELYPDRIWRLHGDLQPQLEEAGLDRLMEDVDLPLCPVLAAMEERGLGVEEQIFTDLEEGLRQRIGEIEDEIAEVAGERINLQSPKQVRELLFDVLGLPPQKKTKTGYSTDVTVLEKLAALPGGEVPKMMLEHRELAKLLSSFVHPFMKARNPETGAIHSTFEHTVTGTGRLSSTGPNVQNLPLFGEWARRFRKGLVPRDRDRLFVAADYSQIELRILAHLCRDERLIEAFAAGRDIHRETAASVFSKASREVTPEERRMAKVVNFGLLYGMTAFGLAGRLDVPQSAAQDIVDRYFAAFPSVRAYMDESAEESRKRGHTVTLFGRRRPLREVSTVEGRGAGAIKRVAINTPIQGSAADITRLAMVEVFHRLCRGREGVDMVLQVHDSLVLEVAPDLADQVERDLCRIMEAAADLAVPLVAEPKRGQSLADV
ncbi:MAG: DNA polymerase I [Synergistales bacterium]|nr:DNA polymerase I [Synergistales bacterium]